MVEVQVLNLQREMQRDWRFEMLMWTVHGLLEEAAGVLKSFVILEGGEVMMCRS